MAQAALPRMPLLVAPEGPEAPDVGEYMSSEDLIRGLRMCNSNLVVPMPEHFEHYYPGKAAGHTTLWLGPVGEPGSVKVTTFHLGAIPEFTQIGPDGKIICRGWRSVMEKCVKAGVCSIRSLERVFKRSLANEEAKDSKWCVTCLRAGRMVVNTGGKRRLCYVHEQALDNAALAQENKKELAWTLSQSRESLRRAASRVVVI